MKSSSYLLKPARSLCAQKNFHIFEEKISARGDMNVARGDKYKRLRGMNATHPKINASKTSQSGTKPSLHDLGIHLSRRKPIDDGVSMLAGSVKRCLLVMERCLDVPKRHRDGLNRIAFGSRTILFKGRHRIQLILKEHDRFKKIR